MEKKDLKRHLGEYSIYSKRKTTINHAFASAISHFDTYNDKEVDDALSLLNQKPNAKIKCVYCNSNAETWDHLDALVKNGSFSGNGHHLGNLVPACKKCNSSKGNKNWKNFIRLYKVDPEANTLIEMLNKYVEFFKYKNILFLENRFSKELEEYEKIKHDIFELMKKADEKASSIRQLMEDRSH